MGGVVGTLDELVREAVKLMVMDGASFRACKG